MKIKTLADAKQVADQCIAKMVSEHSVVYFNLSVSDLQGEISPCFFSPVSDIRTGRTGMFFVQDVEKLLRVLLSHPKVSMLEYDPEENAVSALFQDESEPEEETY